MINMNTDNHEIIFIVLILSLVKRYISKIKLHLYFFLKLLFNKIKDISIKIMMEIEKKNANTPLINT